MGLLLAGICVDAILGAKVPEWARPQESVPLIAYHVTEGLAFILVGIIAVWKNEKHTVGFLMTATGAGWLDQALYLVNSPYFFTLAASTSNLYLATLCHLLIVFPTGVASTRNERRTIIAGYVWVIVYATIGQIFWDPRDHCFPLVAFCPQNYLLVYRSRSMNMIESRVIGLYGLVVATSALIIVVRHWTSATPARRRRLAPVVLLAGPSAALVVIINLQQTVDPWSNQDIWNPHAQGIFIGLPIAFLIGILRARLDKSALSGLLGSLAHMPDSRQLTEIVAKTLRDPSVKILRRTSSDELFVDTAGQLRHISSIGSDSRALPLITRDGVPSAILVYDSVHDDDPELVRAVAAAVRLSLENMELHDKLRAQLVEVRASRARLAETADAERRRIERDLHDGAQQYLVALAATLAIARTQTDSSRRDQLDGTLADASGILKRALADLRNLACGLRPAILTEGGLGPALESLCASSVVPANLVGPVPGKLPSLIESTVYFIVAEALTNVAKHSEASAVVVHVRDENRHLALEVRDDGRGGADLHDGTGLQGLSDRVAAVGGDFRLHSEPLHGTRIEVLIPCE